MNEKLQSLIRLEKQYATVAPNGKEHKRVKDEIAMLQKQMTSSPEVPYVKDMITEVKDNTTKRSWNIESFYDKAITATGLNKASQFTFWSSADKWVPLQIQKQNIVKANEDVAGNIAQLEWQKLDKMFANEAAWENAVANLKQLKVNADIQGRQADITEANTAAQLKSQQDTLAEQKRQFDISRWVAPATVKSSPTVNPSGNYTSKKAPTAEEIAKYKIQTNVPKYIEWNVYTDPTTKKQSKVINWKLVPIN